MQAQQRLQGWLGQRIYYGWVVVGVTALTLLVSAGVRGAPGVLINPLEDDFAWSRASISFAVSIGLLLYGLAGPMAGAMMDRFGPKRLMIVGITVVAISTSASMAMSSFWQFTLLWGILGGLGTGIAAVVLGATVANRWFTNRRGLVMGIFGASTSVGQLSFVPVLMWLVTTTGWRGAVALLAISTALLIVPILLLMRDSPAEIGLRASGEQVSAPAEQSAPSGPGVILRAGRTPEFWLLAGSFFICGATSNGLIGTHFIPHSTDIGISEVTAASALGVMGAMNFVGTLASGWLTDRYDPRRLLAFYYILRGCSLLLLPFVDSFIGLMIFATFFGLDYIATVPPTSTLAADIFGRRNVGTIFGWIFAAHQLGAASAAWLGGIARDTLGDYQVSFLAAGALAITGGLMALRVNRYARPSLDRVIPQPSPAAS
jgi:sugar phosphate permease